jgi:integrase
MKSIRAAMVESGRLSRGTVNKHIGRIRRMFKWATSEELVPVDVFTALCTVQGLQRGRTMAKDHDPRRPVEWEDVEKTVEHLPPALKALVLVQWHCGARGGELLAMRPADINRGGDIWEYVPPRHKGSWRGHSRVILLGKDAQSVLAPLLATKGPDDHVFSPRDTRQRAGVGDTYDANAYSKWVRAAAKQAGANHWTPHMLRHAFASRVRSVAGIEQTRVLLGHASAVTSEIYARRDLDQARDVIRQVG